MQMYKVDEFCSLAQVFSDGTKQETIPVDGKAYYLFGREPTTVDIILPGPGASRTHAALVHHEDGKSYLIDLESVRAACVVKRQVTRRPTILAYSYMQTHGTFIKNRKIPSNKPTLLADLNPITFGSSQQKYIFRGETTGMLETNIDSYSRADLINLIPLTCMCTTGSKRKAEAAAATDSSMQQKQTVRASHLLVKHRCEYVQLALLSHMGNVSDQILQQLHQGVDFRHNTALALIVYYLVAIRTQND